MTHVITEHPYFGVFVLFALTAVAFPQHYGLLVLYHENWHDLTRKGLSLVSTSVDQK